MHILANGAEGLFSQLYNYEPFKKIELWKRILKTYLICSQMKNFL